MAKRRPIFDDRQRRALRNEGLADAAINDLQRILPHIAIAKTREPARNAVRAHLARVNKPLAAAVRALRKLQESAVSTPVNMAAVKAFDMLLLARDDREMMIHLLPKIAEQFAAKERRVMIEYQREGDQILEKQATSRRKVDPRLVEMLAGVLVKYEIQPGRGGKFQRIAKTCGITGPAVRAYLNQRAKRHPDTPPRRGRRRRIIRH